MDLQSCYATLRGDIFHAECLRLLVAGCLNVALALGSIIVKLPQVYNIVSSSSVAGLSPASFYLDSLISSLNGIYQYLQGYPFINYADSVFTTVQNVILVLMLWHYSSQKKGLAEILSITSLGLALTTAAFYTPPHLQYLQQIVIFPLMMWSRGAQIAQNFSAKSTGSLSLVSNLLLFLGASAKIFTTISQNMSSQTSDGTLITSSAISAILSGTIVMQIIVYNEAPTQKKQKKTQ